MEPNKIHVITSIDSPEFTHLVDSLSRSSLVGLDAEWKPVRSHDSSSRHFPTVTLLQIACQLENKDSVAFLLDLLAVPLPAVYSLLKEVFICPDILKLGFRFKQDLAFLSSTFCTQGCEPGFEKVEPYLDITSLYNYLRHKQPGRKLPKETKSLAAICEELLGFSLSKELQCSDWSYRPLTEEQKTYAAADAHCLLEVFNIFQRKVVKEGNLAKNVKETQSHFVDYGLKRILEEHNGCGQILIAKLNDASQAVRGSVYSEYPQRTHGLDRFEFSLRYTKRMDDCLLNIVVQYGEKIVLRESDKTPKHSRRKRKPQSSVGMVCKGKNAELDLWQRPGPWDLSLGGDGCPKFLCDVMVEGLAKHLRCVGIDAAIPSTKKPNARELIDQAIKEKRVILTRDAKLLRHDYLIRSQIYRVKSLLKDEQLLEVIKTFEVKICEDQLMTRCTKCNGRFIQKPLTTEEAVEAGKGFQIIPNCLFNKDIEFWQCMDCSQLYWEGTQYHNAVQKFIDVCKLNE